MSEPWRLLLDPAAPGAWNMAVDELLLDGVDQATAPPTLRFYQWRPACLSLGYFQSFDVVDLPGCRRQGIDIVRRPTGGRAILHDAEVTYSVALPASVLGHDAGILPSYHRLSLALSDGLRELGVKSTLAPESAAPARILSGPVCFDSPSAHEILLNGRKLVGSAQVRRNRALLQHGSIVLEPRVQALLGCLRLPPGSVGLGGSMAGLAEVGIFAPAAIGAAVGGAISRQFGVRLVPGALTAGELERARRLAASKYQTALWTERAGSEGSRETTRTR
jgi:lipoyl(octanoyl) transferase